VDAVLVELKTKPAHGFSLASLSEGTFRPSRFDRFFGGGALSAPASPSEAPSGLRISLVKANRRSVCGVLETFLQKVSDFLLSGRFLHYSVVHIGYSAFAVNQRR
jgi:hypothetical protein